MKSKKEKTNNDRTMMSVSKTAYRRFKTACEKRGLLVWFITNEMVVSKTAELERLDKI